MVWSIGGVWSEMTSREEEEEGRKWFSEFLRIGVIAWFQYEWDIGCGIEIFPSALPLDKSACINFLSEKSCNITASVFS